MHERLRGRLFSRQVGVCPRCGRALPTPNGAGVKIGFAVALTNGGENNSDNMVMIHASCAKVRVAETA